MENGRKETPYTETGLKTQVAPEARQVQQGAERLEDSSL